MEKKKYLVGLRKTDDFCCPTILVSAKDEDDARALVKHLKPNVQIGKIKQVNY